MGKPFNLQFELAPSGMSAGTMECGVCHKPIDNKSQDFRIAQKTVQGDWVYITHHRRCLSDQSGFEAVEAKNAAWIKRNADLWDAAIAFRDKWQISDLDELIEERATPTQVEKGGAE